MDMVQVRWTVLLIVLFAVLVFGCTGRTEPAAAGPEPVPSGSGPVAAPAGSVSDTASISPRLEQDNSAGNSGSSAAPGTEIPVAGYDKFVGRWRNYSNVLDPHELEMHADGTWTLEQASGTWRVEEIREEDWTRWGISPYGPTRKIVFDGWGPGIVDGPVEESADRVDFFWLIYTVEWPSPGSWAQVQIKYGHVNADL